eukprot:1157841-Pelagomonas_calceolata.AAC.2
MIRRNMVIWTQRSCLQGSLDTHGLSTQAYAGTWSFENIREQGVFQQAQPRSSGIKHTCKGPGLLGQE